VKCFVGSNETDVAMLMLYQSVVVLNTSRLIA
jgi:hypothetical protein